MIALDYLRQIYCKLCVQFEVSNVVTRMAEGSGTTATDVASHTFIDGEVRSWTVYVKTGSVIITYPSGDTVNGVAGEVYNNVTDSDNVVEDITGLTVVGTAATAEWKVGVTV